MNSHVESQLVLMMTSPSSGYITVRNNGSHNGARYCWKNISVPASYAVMTSFKAFVLDRYSFVYLYGHFKKYTTSTGRFKEDMAKIWDNSKSSFAHVYNTSKLTVKVSSYMSMNRNHFQLFFSFFIKNKTPLKLSADLWNCSVNHYREFYQHLDCNLKTECEDGRDETEHCPFSSPECKGLVSMCNRCYILVENLRRLGDEKNTDNKKAKEVCNSLGGMLSFPKCVEDWYWAFQNLTNINPGRLHCLWTGLTIVDLSLPSMYRYCLIQEDKTIFYHTIQVYESLYFLETFCLQTDCSYSSSEFKLVSCFKNCYLCSTICELRTNRSKENDYTSHTVSMTSTRVLLFKEQESVTMCNNGHMTHTFLLCGSRQSTVCGDEHNSSCSFSDQLHHKNPLNLTDHLGELIPTFTCSHEITLPYTLVCDFISDCQDKSDESFCKHPVCIKTFSCISGQCVSYRSACDQVTHCHDASDEENCAFFKTVPFNMPFFPSPALVDFDGIQRFVSTPMNSSESCPDSHYRCPGEFNDCLPVYTRCNGMYDCIDHQDEVGCEEMTCPGYFRCRAFTLCVHRDHLCDSWPHCPMYDDELSCDVTCPVGCLCQGHTFLCHQTFSATLFPQLRSLDATGSGMALSDVSNNDYLVRLVLAKCSVSVLSDTVLLNLKFFDLSSNKLQNVNMTFFLRFKTLHSLSLSNNPLTSLYSDLTSGIQQRALTVVDLSYSRLTVFDTIVLSQFAQLQKLNLTFTSMHTVAPSGFKFTPQLSELYMEGSPLKTFPPDIFKDISRLRVISTHNYKLCCSEVLLHNFENTYCSAPHDEISSCDDLLQSAMYRGLLWPITCLSLTGNIFCFIVRLCAQKMISSSGFSVFVTNLTLADFLMGVYIAVIGVADDRFRGRYLHYDGTWKSSVVCQMAGFLSLLSSEVSALIIWLITLDRFVVLRFPFSSLHFQRTSAGVACLLAWLLGFSLALLPLLPITSHWEFYSQTGICIPLPVTRQEFKGRVYSFSILIIFNFVLFLLISAGQAFIYWSIQNNALKINTTKVSRDMTIARRLITVAVTDFMCWFPIGLCGILAFAGTAIPGEVNVALAIFVLPLNSAINPFMYTFNTLAEKRKKSIETKLLKWMESHADLIV